MDGSPGSGVPPIAIRIAFLGRAAFSQNGRTRHLSAEDAQKLLEACEPTLRILVLTAMHTGFRKSEVRSLKWSAVDLVHGSITIESCYAKNGEARTVPMSPDLAAAFEKLKNERKPKG